MSDERAAYKAGATPGPRRIAIVVAMEREIEPLFARWRSRGKRIERKGLSVLDGYTCEGTQVMIAGIGRKNAAMAARAVIDHHQPQCIVSAGLAGALRANLAAGSVICPAVVFDAMTKQKYTCTGSSGHGVLVTANSVLSREQKEKLGVEFGGDVVDMEAAVVGEVAHASGIPFVAVKAISDDLSLAMPPMDRFIDAAGQLSLLKLIGYAALRPRIWKALNELRKNSRVAAEALAGKLDEIVSPVIAQQ